MEINKNILSLEKKESCYCWRVTRNDESIACVNVLTNRRKRSKEKKGEIYAGRCFSLSFSLFYSMAVFLCPPLSSLSYAIYCSLPALFFLFFLQTEYYRKKNVVLYSLHDRITKCNINLCRGSNIFTNIFCLLFEIYHAELLVFPRLTICYDIDKVITSWTYIYVFLAYDR